MEDARIVEDEQIAGCEKLGQIAKRALAEFAGGAIQREQTRRVARLGRGLSDELRGKFVVEEVGHLKFLSHLSNSPLCRSTVADGPVRVMKYGPFSQSKKTPSRR